MAEASLVASPTNSPPSGTYALSLSTPTNIQSSCLVDSANNQAWDCDLAGSPALAISVGVPAAPRPTEGAFFFYASSDPGFEYGAQYKFMDTEFSTYEPVQEYGDVDRGPAFYFGQKYDKIVLLPETAFPQVSGTPSRRRRDFQMPKGWNNRKQAINHGDKPWMCIWNDTLIEGWIYVDQNITSSFPISTSLPPSSTATSNSTPTENTASTYTTPLSTSDVLSGPRAQLSPTGLTTSVSSGSTSTMTVTQISTTTPATWTKGRGPPPGKFSDDDYYDDDGETSGHKLRRDGLEARATGSAVDLDIAVVDDNDDDDDDNDDDNGLTPEEEEALDTYHGLPPYPYLIKIEERRVPEEGNTPYCQQFQLLDSNDLVPYSDEANPTGVRFEMPEQPPPYSAYEDTHTFSEKSRLRKRDPPSRACHCEWWAE